MNKIKFIVGLSDKQHKGIYVDSNTGYFEHPDDIQEYHYNLRKQSPQHVQATVEWELIDTPVTREVMNAWERTITAPHMRMVRLFDKPTTTEQKRDFEFFLNFIRFVENYEEYKFTEEDGELIEITPPEYGDLYLSFGPASIPMNTDHNTTWCHALYIKDTGKLSQGPNQWYARPYFTASFQHTPFDEPVTNMWDLDVQWIEDNKDKLLELGYKLDSTMNKVGSYKLGKLVTPVASVIDTFSKYPYVTHQSIVVEK